MGQMQSKTIFVYSDASFAKHEGIAIIGSLTFIGDADHQNGAISEKQKKINSIKEVNNIRAEIKSVLLALQQFTGTEKILLYTDCQAIVNLPSRRKKLEESGYISKSKNQLLANFDLYQEFYALFDRVNPEIHWVKGHNKAKDLTRIEKNFANLDKEVRRVLRETINK